MKWQAYPKYKDSGIEWLGEIPEHWETRRLKYISSLNDETLGETTNPDFQLLYVDISSVDAIAGIQHKEKLAFGDAPSRARRKVRHGDIIVSTVRTYLRAIAPVVEPEANLIVSTGFAVVRPMNELDSQFALYALRAPYFVEEVVANSVGVSYPAINTSELATFFVALPPQDEQRAIAAFLDRETERLDALIARKERQIELLQEKRAALISHVVTKGLDPNAPMKDSGVEWLGEIPAHWELMSLKFAVLQKPDAIKTGPFGSQLLSSEMMDSEVKVYNQRNVIDQDLTQGDNYVSREKYEELRAFTVFPGDVLVTTRGTIGRCVIVPDDADLGVLHPCLIRVQPDSRKLLARFLVLLIQDSFLVQTQLFLMSNATTIEVIYSGNLRDAIVPIPPVQEQCTIIAHLDREISKSDTLIAKVRASIERLQEYRTALIPAAVTGKIDVQNSNPALIEQTQLRKEKCNADNN